jgi:hypothetical protein
LKEGLERFGTEHSCLTKERRQLDVAYKRMAEYAKARSRSNVARRIVDE